MVRPPRGDWSSPLRNLLGLAHRECLLQSLGGFCSSCGGMQSEAAMVTSGPTRFFSFPVLGFLNSLGSVISIVYFSLCLDICDVM